MGSGVGRFSGLVRHPPADLSAESIRFVPPRFPTLELADAAERLFGLSGRLEPLAGERDQNHCLSTPDGTRYVLKVSGPDADPATVDFQVQALLHLERAAPGLAVPRIVLSLDGAPSAVLKDSADKPHFVRLLNYLPGTPFEACPPPSLAAIRRIGSFQARLCRGLAGFFHVAAGNFMPWDLTRGLVLHQDLRRHIPAEAAHWAEPVLRRLEEVLPHLPSLRAQVIHHDAHLGNLLRDPSGSEAVTGVIDFGDMVHNPLIMDLAVSLASIAERAHSVCEAAQALVAGFNSVLPLEVEEIDLLLDLALARVILTIQLENLKAYQGSDRPAAAQSPCVSALQRLSAIDADVFASSLRGACGQPLQAGTKSRLPPGDLMARRRRAFGSSATLFYERPVHIVRGRDIWLYDADGREYLDCYNNVPSVGHCHPHVVSALARQAASLNTHTRYLHEAVVEYAERIAATLPDELSVCFFTCTGSEANDLAFRIARTVTGAEGAIVTENSYHGTTIAGTDLSTMEYPREDRPVWLETIEPPDLYRGSFGGVHPEPGAVCAGQVGEAVAALERRQVRTAMLMYDSIFDAPGIHTAPPDYLRLAHAAVHAAGGLVVADEVQAGLCRLGDHVWGFQDSGVVPDIVTLGKPMGNGHPIGAVVTTPAIAETFTSRFSYFNTFAGNPVSAAAGLAVLDVVESEHLLANAGETGRALGMKLQSLAELHESVGSVRGKGLFWGIDLVSNRQTRAPDAEAARRVAEAMRREGVLIAASGPHGNVLKIRPPLTFRPAHTARLIAALDRSLGEISVY